MYCISGGIVHTFLTLALDGGGLWASRPGRFTPDERAPATHWLRRLGGSHSWSERDGEGIKIPALTVKSNPGRLSRKSKK
jgi:hypothetical protein